MCELFSLIVSKKHHARETDTIKIWAIQKKLQFWDAKIDKNTNYAKLPISKGLFLKSHHSRIEILQKYSTFYCVSFSGESFLFEGMRENTLDIFRA